MSGGACAARRGVWPRCQGLAGFAGGNERRENRIDPSPSEFPGNGKAGKKSCFLAARGLRTQLRIRKRIRIPAKQGVAFASRLGGVGIPGVVAYSACRDLRGESAFPVEARFGSSADLLAFCHLCCPACALIEFPC